MTSTSRTLLVIASLLTASGAGYGCNKTPEQAQQDNMEAQQKADQKAADARARGEFTFTAFGTEQVLPS